MNFVRSLLILSLSFNSLVFAQQPSVEDIALKHKTAVTYSIREVVAKLDDVTINLENLKYLLEQTSTPTSDTLLGGSNLTVSAAAAFLLSIAAAAFFVRGLNKGHYEFSVLGTIVGVGYGGLALALSHVISVVDLLRPGQKIDKVKIQKELDRAIGAINNLEASFSTDQVEKIKEIIGDAQAILLITDEQTQTFERKKLLVKTAGILTAGGVLGALVFGRKGDKMAAILTIPFVAAGIFNLVSSMNQSDKSQIIAAIDNLIVTIDKTKLDLALNQ